MLERQTMPPLWNIRQSRRDESIAAALSGESVYFCCVCWNMRSMRSLTASAVAFASSAASAARSAVATARSTAAAVSRWAASISPILPSIAERRLPMEAASASLWADIPPVQQPDKATAVAGAASSMTKGLIFFIRFPGSPASQRRLFWRTARIFANHRTKCKRCMFFCTSNSALPSTCDASLSRRGPYLG